MGLSRFLLIPPFYIDNIFYQDSNQYLLRYCSFPRTAFSAPANSRSVCASSEVILSTTFKRYIRQSAPIDRRKEPTTRNAINSRGDKEDTSWLTKSTFPMTHKKIKTNPDNISSTSGARKAKLVKLSVLSAIRLVAVNSKYSIS